MKVLLIESSDICINVIMTMLATRTKATVFEFAHSPSEAISKLDKFSPDIMVIDSEFLPVDFDELKKVPMVIFTNKDHLDKAMEWSKGESANMLVDAVTRAAERKETFERIEKIREKMDEQTERMKKEIGMT